jgi:membrane protease YdiL (CAAX protease family)
LRYLKLLVFAGILAAACLAVDAVLVGSGSGYSLSDSRGPGQIALFLIIIPAIALFSRFVAGVDIFGWFGLYWRERGRALRGFGIAFAFGFGVMLAGYLFLAAMGQASFSQAAWQAMSLKIVERTLVGLLVVVVLATTEELIFRGFVLRYLRSATGAALTIAAVVASSAIFSVTHLIALPPPHFTLDYLPLLFGLFLLGALLAVTYLATGSLAMSIGLHSGLLGFKVFLRKTQLVEVTPEAWWLNESTDIRVSPVAWGVLVAMGVVIFLLRHRLYARFAVERPVVCPPQGSALVDPRLTAPRAALFR